MVVRQSVLLHGRVLAAMAVSVDVERRVDTAALDMSHAAVGVSRLCSLELY